MLSSVVFTFLITNVAWFSMLTRPARYDGVDVKFSLLPSRFSAIIRFAFAVLDVSNLGMNVLQRTAASSVSWFLSVTEYVHTSLASLPSCTYTFLKAGEISVGSVNFTTQSEKEVKARGSMSTMLGELVSL